MAMDPTSRGDMQSDLMRRWYEKNREGWLDRHRPSADRKGLHADEFMVRLLNEAGRIFALSDAALFKEHG